MAKLTTAKRERLPDSKFACPIDRKLPINDAAHVRDAMARFDQVTSAGCHPEAAKRRILAAAKRFGVDVKGFQKVKSFKMRGILTPTLAHLYRPDMVSNDMKVSASRADSRKQGLISEDSGPDGI